MNGFAKSVLYLFLICFTFPLQSLAADSVIIEHGVAVKMRDGTILRADIFRPNAPGKFPILLTRTPYDKRHDLDFSLKGVARGYVVINQDVRGRYTSDGEWYPFVHESDDAGEHLDVLVLPYPEILRADAAFRRNRGRFGEDQTSAANGHMPAAANCRTPPKMVAGSARPKFTRVITGKWFAGR